MIIIEEHPIDFFIPPFLLLRMLLLLSNFNFGEMHEEEESS
jgi:hypothetical protein